MFVPQKSSDASLARPEKKRKVKTPLQVKEVKLGIGYDLLMKMGWSGKGGLGTAENGIDRPIELETTSKGVGLGCVKTVVEKRPQKKRQHNNQVQVLECELCGEIVRGRREISKHNQQHRMEKKKNDQKEKKKRRKEEDEEDSLDRNSQPDNQPPVLVHPIPKRRRLPGLNKPFSAPRRLE